MRITDKRRREISEGLFEAFAFFAVAMGLSLALIFVLILLSHLWVWFV